MPRNDERKGTSQRGFASMDQAKQRAIASKGGQSVPPEKRSFSQDPSLAAQAGRKGGESVPPEGRSFSQNRELAAQAGRKGGQARGASAQRRAAAAAAAGGEGPNTEMAGKGTGAPALPRDRSMAGHMSRSDEDNFPAEDMDTGNEDLESEPLDQHPGMPPQQSGKEHPQRAR
jgi:uncharacterized protein